MWQFLLGFIVAWVLCSGYTHTMVALECERLGGFFVGKKIYKCIAIEVPENGQSRSSKESKNIK
ncbi:hypothetical protein HLH12_09280 [Acinetobacter sp. NIPH 2377]|uniref:hypothetical protein n=1 Tax=Acinetobacter terrestris TaxID=2529843 RepID=UPI00148F5745|nr:hypothetical protein [Acinetobacter terrestris]NNH35735.1 hypothetical protein [Acinetobacter terrestris]